jgi:hypothetical protein
VSPQALQMAMAVALAVPAEDDLQSVA